MSEKSTADVSDEAVVYSESHIANWTFIGFGPNETHIRGVDSGVNDGIFGPEVRFERTQPFKAMEMGNVP